MSDYLGKETSESSPLFPTKNQSLRLVTVAEESAGTRLRLGHKKVGHNPTYYVRCPNGVVVGSIIWNSPIRARRGTRDGRERHPHDALQLPRTGAPGTPPATPPPPQGRPDGDHPPFHAVHTYLPLPTFNSAVWVDTTTAQQRRVMHLRLHRQPFQLQ